MPTKIVLFGPECTGKSTLAVALASHYQAPMVPEFLRTYSQDKWDRQSKAVTESDIEPLIMGQLTQERDALDQANQFDLCDTDILQLAVYFDYYYEAKWPTTLKSLCQQDSGTFYFLTAPDVPWVADDLRDRPLEREALFHIFEQALKIRDLTYMVLRGDEKARFAAATNYIDTHWPQ